MSDASWEVAVIGPDEGRNALVAWNVLRRLPSELIPLALQLGYSEEELSRYSIGELCEDLVIGDELYLRGALVIPDEDGLPASLFGKPLIGKSISTGSKSVR
jgi:hypothetical protein